MVCLGFRSLLIGARDSSDYRAADRATRTNAIGCRRTADCTSKRFAECTERETRGALIYRAATAAGAADGFRGTCHEWYAQAPGTIVFSLISRRLDSVRRATRKQRN